MSIISMREDGRVHSRFEANKVYFLMAMEELKCTLYVPLPKNFDIKNKGPIVKHAHHAHSFFFLFSFFF